MNKLIVSLFIWALKAGRFTIYSFWWVTKTLFSSASERYGSARFSHRKELKESGMLKTDGLVLAKTHFGTIHSPDQGHLFCVAPTGAGKTTGLVLPNVMSIGEKASLLIIDPKGEVRNTSCTVRRQHGKIHVWAAFEHLSASCNPLDFIRVGTLDERDDVDLLISLLLPYGKTEEPFWVDEARQLVMGLILFVLYEKPRSLRCMAEVRHLLTLARRDFMDVMHCMALSHHAVIRRVAQAILQKDDRQFSGVLATAQSKTRIWDSPRLTNVTNRSDFSFADLKESVVTIYLVIPPERLDSYYPALRVMVGLAIAEASRTPAKGSHRVTFMLDEFANLGRLPPAESAISIARSAGVQLCLFVQDLAQLKRVYGDSWRSFAANCQTKVFFGINDIDEAKRLSETLGKSTIRTQNQSSSMEFGHLLLPERTSSGQSETSRSLLTPDELLTLPRDKLIILQSGLRPILATRLYHPVGDAPFLENLDLYPPTRPALPKGKQQRFLAKFSATLQLRGK